jgi:hypothetical protein
MDAVLMSGPFCGDGENPMDDYVPPPLNVTFGAILRVSVLVSLVWIVGDALDGGSQSLLPPLLIAAWLYAMVVLDRWVTTGFRGTGAGSPSTPRRLPELIGKGR